MRAVTPHTAVDGTTTYRVRFRAGGRQRSETFRKKKDAATFAAHLDGGGPVAALAWLHSKDTYEATLTLDQWFAHYADQLTGITDRTRRSYTSMYDNHLAHLGTLPLPLLTRTHFTTLVNAMERDGKSPKTIRNVMALAATCLRLAVEERHITSNPATRIRMPAKAHDSRAVFFTHEEFGLIHAHMTPHYQPLTAFLVGTGLRWSEATALQVRHVDLGAGTVRVEQAWKETGGRVLGVPKSAAGFRTVNAATGALVAVEPLMRGKKPGDWLFTAPGGGIVRHSNYRLRAWKPACEAAGMGDPLPRIHSLRSTHASWLISDGIQLEAVQDQLGHESILTTRKIYGHLLPALGVAVGKSASAGLARALDGVQLTPVLGVADSADQPR